MADIDPPERLNSPQVDLEEQTRQAAILDRHLPEGYSADADVSLATTQADGPASSSSPNANGQTNSTSPKVSADATDVFDEPPVESSLLLQGGDMHRDMFRIKARAGSLRRANTFSHQASPRLHAADELTYPEQREPGGFRRSHIQQQQRRRRHQRSQSGPLLVARSFVEFLDLYGSFAGEDLEDTDTDDEGSSAIDDIEEGAEEDDVPEQRPLLPRRRSTRGRREGDASTLKTFFTLLKAFVGTGIMFLPKAFANGGILFSSLCLVAVSLVNCLCFRLLLDCRARCGGGGYGELGATIVGPRFRSLVLGSIALSQLGFVCAGVIFTAENLWSFLDAVTARTDWGSGRDHAGPPVGVTVLIALQLIPLIPLALIRNISKLGPVALIADAFILVGIVYIWQYDATALASRGMDPTVRLFNPTSFPLTVGSAIFTFEGIGLILPIQSSMRKPKHFEPLLYLVMIIITVIFASVGALCYATFGDRTNIQIISNFPQDSPVVNGVQLLYSLAVLAGEPVQLFPATRILETSMFGERATGKRSATIKWKKNGVRAGAVALCVAVSVAGASDLDKFVALVGSFACVPLVYIYPAYLHYKAAAETKWQKGVDVVLMVVGLVAMVYTTAVTVFQWIDG